MKLSPVQHVPPVAGRQNSIGALRLLLASLVIYTHAFYLGGFGTEPLGRLSHGTLTAGDLAVQCFFVLSGWLVAISWVRQPQLGRFLWHRFLRLAPAFWVCLVVTAFVFSPLIWLFPRNPIPFFQQEPGAWDYVRNNFLTPREQMGVGSLPYRGPWPGDWNGSLWTLFYEGACYVMVAGLGVAGLLTRWRWLGTALIAGLILLHFATPLAWAAPLSRLYDTPGKLLTLHFLAGATWAVWTHDRLPLWVSPWLILGLVVLLVMSWHYAAHPWVSPLLLPPALLWLAHRGSLAGFERMVGGDYSYGVYLYGYPVQQLLSHFRVNQLGLTAYLVAGFAGALACGALSWHLVEKPALALKSPGRSPLTTPVSV
jgi:peptidoglycan/LPS O-acetylase OafA/YrhL